MWTDGTLSKIANQGATPAKTKTVMPISEFNNQLKVSTDGTAGPYVVVTPEQLGHVVAALREAGINCQVDEDAVLSGGTPALAVINLDHEADVKNTQAVLAQVANDLTAKTKRRRLSPTREELAVRGRPPAMDELMKRLDTDHVARWLRQRDIEARFKNTLPTGARCFCFSKNDSDLGWHVAVLLRNRSPVNPDELFVSGVVPMGRFQEFSPKDHDAVIADVRDTLIKPLAEDLPVRVLVYRVHVGPAIEDSLPPDALTKLWAFSETANKTNLHPLDRMRWAEFIKQVHVDVAEIDSSSLAVWLADAGFPKTQRDDLIREYESGRHLLRLYDEERG